MRYAIDTIPLDFSRGNLVDLNIKGYRKVIGSTLVEKRGGLVMAGHGGAAPVVLCALVVEYDPDGPEIPCRFVGVPPGLCVESKEIGGGSLEHVATIIAAGQPPFAIYRAPGRLPSVES